VAIGQFIVYKFDKSVGITWLVELPSQYVVCVYTLHFILSVYIL